MVHPAQSTGRKAGAPPGDDLFQSLCNIMADGARTVLLTRWRTAGRTNFDLVREFTKDSADAPAAEAWQRACLFARENPVDQTYEPRLKHSDETTDAPTADHPFFWAGYLLVDTGPRAPKPEGTEQPDASKPDAAKEKTLPKPAKTNESAEEPPAPNGVKKPPKTDSSRSPATDSVHQSQ